LANIDLIEKTVDAAILLIDTDSQGYWMPCIMSYLLEFKAEFRGVLSR
jgi:hypothetical protein|tara:strand:- start:39418 stop:39561 length:144 start_codon:yes stop_codon:yes gene_type:complete